MAQIQLYTVGTPNGHKVSIYLEELKAVGALPAEGYDYKAISFKDNEQKEPWFLKICPNGRIPALVHNRPEKGPINVWESASILLYLARTFDRQYTFWFVDEDLQQEALNWIFFLQGGVGPMQGQANHFFRYAPEKIPYGINRYQNETRRLYSVYEEQLKDKDWLVGNKYSIADIVSYPWIRAHDWAGVPTDEFPKLNSWLERIAARDAVQKGLDVPTGSGKMSTDPKEMERRAKEAQEWIMKDQQKKD